MDLRKLADAILETAEKVAPLIPGATDDAAVAGARALVNLIDAYHEAAGAPVPELEAKRAELEARVLKGLRNEANALRG
jgi:hypothetical protein